MKTKLLKIVRERFEIIDYPKGNIYNNEIYTDPHFHLNDKKSSWGYKYTYQKNDPYNRMVILEIVHTHLMKKIKRKYFEKVKKSKIKNNKVWYNK